MSSEKILLASFVHKDNYESFMNFLVNKHSSQRNEVNVYEIDNNTKEVLFVYKFSQTNQDDIRVEYPKIRFFRVNSKKGCIFSINAINKLIDKMVGLEHVGNINYKTYKIDFSKYKDNLIITKGGELTITAITKISDVC